MITVEDVEAAAGLESGGRARWETLRGVRRVMARNMARAHREVVPATVTEEAVLSQPLSAHNVTVALVRAMGAACVAEPALNAWYNDQRGARLVHERVDLGIAVDTEKGLFVPVLRDIRQERRRTSPPRSRRSNVIPLSVLSRKRTSRDRRSRCPTLGLRADATQPSW